MLPWCPLSHTGIAIQRSLVLSTGAAVKKKASFFKFPCPPSSKWVQKWQVTWNRVTCGCSHLFKDIWPWKRWPKCHRAQCSSLQGTRAIGGPWWPVVRPPTLHKCENTPSWCLSQWFQMCRSPHIRIIGESAPPPLLWKLMKNTGLEGLFTAPSTGPPSNATWEMPVHLLQIKDQRIAVLRLWRISNHQTRHRRMRHPCTSWWCRCYPCSVYCPLALVAFNGPNWKPFHQLCREREFQGCTFIFRASECCN